MSQIRGLYSRNIGSSYFNLMKSISLCRPNAIPGDDVCLGHRIVRAAAASYNLQQYRKQSHGRYKLEQERRNYYDLLALTPKATQAQVKDAYYNMSKLYHPDLNKGADAGDAAVKFREITEAYEVLGNYHKRKMYDRGMLNISSVATPTEAEDYSKKFYESRRTRGQAPAATGRTPIYNFDEWSKLHYDSARERRESAKIRYENLKKTRTELVEEKKTESFVSFLALFLLCISLNWLMNSEADKRKSKSN